tara:strand:- start:181 stop:1170 length:990 start_codon:yes stop_codon:yes gene_type:complete
MTILIIGGGGYVGSLLVKKLIERKMNVLVLDLFMYGSPEIVFSGFHDSEHLQTIKGDLRDIDLIENLISKTDNIIHLACISNDPSFELNPNLGKSINYDSFYPLIKACKKKINKFIYASSSSVYGIKNEKNVTEELPLEPLTDYSKFKVLCEDILLNETGNNFCSTILRPATVCGYSPRTRLDVIVNILTNNAYNKRKIIINGGRQKRPNIHIEDMVRAYIEIICQPNEKVNDEIFNVGFENYTLDEIGSLVKRKIGEDVIINYQKTSDERSYHISSRKIFELLKFRPKYSIERGVEDLKKAFEHNLLNNSFNDPKYFNIKMMQKINLQ